MGTRQAYPNRSSPRLSMRIIPKYVANMSTDRTIADSGIKKQKYAHNRRCNLGTLFSRRLRRPRTRHIYDTKSPKESRRNKSRRDTRCIPILPLCSRYRIRATVLFHSSGRIYVFTTRVAFFFFFFFSETRACVSVLQERSTSACVFFGCARIEAWSFYPRGYYIYLFRCRNFIDIVYSLVELSVIIVWFIEIMIKR